MSGQKPLPPPPLPPPLISLAPHRIKKQKKRVADLKRSKRVKHGSTRWSSFNGTSFIIHIATYMHHVTLKSGKWQVFFSRV